MNCKTLGCETPVIRKSRRGRPPQYCDGCKSGYAADVRSKTGTSHQPPPQPHMPAEEHAADRALLIDYVLEHGPIESIALDDSEVYEHLMGAVQVKDRRDRAVRYLRRETLRMPVMDLENEPARGPRTIGTDSLVPGGSDEYYEAKRRLGLITDERATS